MVVSRWSNSLGVRRPRALVDDLVKPGDELEVVKDLRRAQAVDRMRARVSLE